jgi:hypothetical protein
MPDRDNVLMSEHDDKDEDTFSGTLAGLEKLRGTYKDEDWKEWRRTVLAAVRAGSAMERRQRQIELNLLQLAKQSGVDALITRVTKIEWDRDQAAGTKTKVWAMAQKVALIIAGAVVAKWWH